VVAEKEELRRTLVAIQHETEATHDLFIASGASLDNKRSDISASSREALNLTSSSSSSSLESLPEHLVPSFSILSTLYSIQQATKTLIDQRDQYQRRSEKAYTTGVLQTTMKIKPIMDRVASGTSVKSITAICGETQAALGSVPSILLKSGSSSRRISVADSLSSSAFDRASIDSQDSVLLERITKVVWC
jgi:hypothetical protein